MHASDKKAQVLEVGCGTGRLMAVMEENGYEVTGLGLLSTMEASSLRNVS